MQISHLVCKHVASGSLPVFFLLGQVKQMVREEEQQQDGAKLAHIRIPAAYSSGVTLFALRQSELGQELLSAPELSLLGLDWHSWTQALKLEDLFIVIWNSFFDPSV